MKVLIIAGAALTAIISATVFAGNISDQAVDTTVVETMNLEASTLAASPCELAVLQFTGDIVLEKATQTEFTHFCTDRMFQRATKIPKEEFIWAIYDMQRAAGRALTPLTRLTATFDKIDKDGDKVINMKELNVYTGRLQPPVLGAAGCGTCGQDQPGCKVGCHCHNRGDCGKDGDGSKFSMEGLVKQ